MLCRLCYVVLFLTLRFSYQCSAVEQDKVAGHYLSSMLSILIGECLLEEETSCLSEFEVPYSEKFSRGANFAFFEGKAVNARNKTGRNSHAPVFHMQRLWWVWFLGIEPRISQSRTFLLGASRAIPRKFAPSKLFSRYMYYW